MEQLQLVWVHWKELRQELWQDRLGCSQAQQSEQLVQLGLHLLRFETGNRQNNKTLFGCAFGCANTERWKRERSTSSTAIRYST